METLILICDPYLSYEDRHAFCNRFEDLYGFTPALAFRIKTSQF